MTTHGKQTGSQTRRRWLVGGLALLGAGLAGSAFGQAGGQGVLAPLVNNAGKAAIPDHYIVVLKPGASPGAAASAQSAAQNAGGTIGFTYRAALTGFSVVASPAAIDRLRAQPDVSYVEVDSVFTADTVQAGPPTGLDRTSERLLPLDNRYTYSEDGTGVHAYVLDTGIRTTHTEFGGRASGAFTAIADGHGTDDCAGHGTHVAGTIGGITYGIAKNITLHAVRVLDCAGNGTLSGIVSGIDWVTANATLPAVANMSLGGPFSLTMNAAVTNSIGAGVTYTIAAGNNDDDACNYSPAATPDAITVGNIDPTNDTRAFDSNWGACLDLFAPGENILSAWWTGDVATNVISGTSMAAPHVAGAAARYLQLHPGAGPGDVWTYLRSVADVNPGTPGWPGIVDPEVGSPDVLLHIGSRNDGFDDGDPHLVTVGGIAYDFQSGGEFTLLRDGNGLEIQTRQTPVETNFTPGPNAYTGLASCPSLNTAVAARVGRHRVSFEPEPGGEPTPNGLQLRINGGLTTVPAGGLALSPTSRIMRTTDGGIEINFPDGTTMIATPLFWTSQGKWFLNVEVFHSIASEGVIGALAPGSWLPALPGGGSLGPKPATLHQRYIDLNVAFANAWRVTNATSLFDYAPGTSTANYTFPAWPAEKGPCVLPDSDDIPVDPLDPTTAQHACGAIVNKTRRANCIADVQATGDVVFATAHGISERIINGSTNTLLDDLRNPTAPGGEARLTATVIRNAAGAAVPVGSVQLFVDGRETGSSIQLDARGHAVWKLTNLSTGSHQISARYAPAAGSVFAASSSLPRSHTVR